MDVKKHDGLDLIGIIIIYIVTSLYTISMLFSWISLKGLETGEFVLLSIVLISLILTFLYHINIIKNHLWIGILGIFTGVIIGGLFILIADHSTHTKT